MFGRICGYREKKDNKWKNVKIYLNENHYDIIKTTIECGCVDENGRITSPVKPVIKTKSVLLEDINGLVCASEAGEDLERLQAEGKVYYIDVPEKNDYYYEYDATDFYLSKVGTNFGGYDNFKLENLKTKNCVFVDTLIKPFLRTKSDLCDSPNYIKKPGSRKCGIGVAENEDNFVNALKDPNKKMLVDVYKVKPNEIGKYAWQALLNMDEMDRKNSPKISVSVKVSMLRPYKRVDVKDIEKINKTAYTMTTE